VTKWKEGHPQPRQLPAAEIQRIWVPRWVVDRSWALLRQDGRKGVESTVLWGGRRFGSEAVVMSVIYPCGRDVSFSSGLIKVGVDVTGEMGRWLRSEGQRALVQVHTHPGAWTGHSPTDDEGPIVSAEGFVSVVWPHYASIPPRAVHDMGVHRLLGGDWYKVEGANAEALVHIVESEAMIWAPDLTEDGHQEDGAEWSS
jgi:hypothetical protein